MIGYDDPQLITSEYYTVGQSNNIALNLARRHEAGDWSRSCAGSRAVLAIAACRQHPCTINTSDLQTWIIAHKCPCHDLRLIVLAFPHSQHWNRCILNRRGMARGPWTVTWLLTRGAVVALAAGVPETASQACSLIHPVPQPTSWPFMCSAPCR